MNMMALRFKYRLPSLSSVLLPAIPLSIFYDGYVSDTMVASGLTHQTVSDTEATWARPVLLHPQESCTTAEKISVLE